MTGSTTVTGLAFDAKCRLYVLELSAVQTPDFPGPFTGKIVRVDASGQIVDFVTRLMVPTGLTIGPDGTLYVSNWGAVPSSAGQILRITNPD
jgi:sugar lactone lactonase YvrE